MASFDSPCNIPQSVLIAAINEKQASITRTVAEVEVLQALLRSQIRHGLMTRGARALTTQETIPDVQA